MTTTLNVGVVGYSAQKFNQEEATKMLREAYDALSETFLNSIDILVRIGGGNQSRRETEEFKQRGKKVLEYELAVEK